MDDYGNCVETVAELRTALAQTEARWAVERHQREQAEAEQVRFAADAADHVRALERERDERLAEGNELAVQLAQAEAALAATPVAAIEGVYYLAASRAEYAQVGEWLAAQRPVPTP